MPKDPKLQEWPRTHSSPHTRHQTQGLVHTNSRYGCCKHQSDNVCRVWTPQRLSTGEGAVSHFTPKALKQL